MSNWHIIECFAKKIPCGPGHSFNVVRTVCPPQSRPAFECFRRIRMVCILFFFMSCSSNLIRAQVSYCSSKFESYELKRFLNNRQQLSSTPRKQDVFIPIKFHAAADDQGNGRIGLNDVLDQLCQLNANFTAVGFQFYLKDGTVNNINSTVLYEQPYSSSGWNEIIAQKSEFGKNAINIFITESAGAGIDGSGNNLGYYDPNQDYIVVKKEAFSTPLFSYFPLAHELGHFFSLPHTFRGWDFTPWDGGQIQDTMSPSGIIYELADGSNCERAGDLLCDTPADYNLGFGWDGCRPYDGGCRDPKGELLDPDEQNFMGYFLGCDQYHFSEQQAGIMESDYYGSRRAYLRVTYRPSIESVKEVESLISPLEGATMPNYNSVALAWKASANATHYLIEVSSGNEKLDFISHESSVFIATLKPNTTYNWRVKAFSDYFTCTDYSTTRTFKTGSLTSSIYESQPLYLAVNVWPIPFYGESLNIEVRNSINTVSELEIWDLSGKKIYSKKFVENKIKLADLRFNSGVYLLKLKNGKDQITKKIVVNE